MAEPEHKLEPKPPPKPEVRELQKIRRELLTLGSRIEKLVDSLSRFNENVSVGSR